MRERPLKAATGSREVSRPHRLRATVKEESTGNQFGRAKISIGPITDGVTFARPAPPALVTWSEAGRGHDDLLG